MNDLTALHKRITVLSRVENADESGRELLGNDCNDPHQAFLEEVAETQFLRRLTFTNDRGETVNCDVMSGRVLWIWQDRPNPRGDLSEADDDEKNAQISVCGNLLAGTASLKVRSDLIRTDIVRDGYGLTLTPDMFDRSQGIKRQGFQVERFAAKLADLSTALVRVDHGQISNAVGQDRQLEHLLALAKEEASSAAPPMQETSSGHFVLLSTGRGIENSNGQAALCAAISNTVLFVSFPAGSMKDVIRCWSDAKG